MVRLPRAGRQARHAESLRPCRAQQRAPQQPPHLRPAPRDQAAGPPSDILDGVLADIRRVERSFLMPSDWYDHTPVTEALPGAAERLDPSSEELDAEPREDQEDRKSVV